MTKSFRDEWFFSFSASWICQVISFPPNLCIKVLLFCFIYRCLNIELVCQIHLFIYFQLVFMSCSLKLSNSFLSLEDLIWHPRDERSDQEHFSFELEHKHQEYLTGLYWISGFHTAKQFNNFGLFSELDTVFYFTHLWEKYCFV